MSRIIRRAHLKRYIWLLLPLLLLSFPGKPASGHLAGLKAAYVYNIAKFTRWPESALAKNMRLFRLCVYGSGETIEELKKLNGRPLSTRSVAIVEPKFESDFYQCQLLYISSSEQRRYRYVLSLINRKQVLTISDDVRFLRHGGLVNLSEQQQKLRFEINNTLLSQAELTMSSKLLKLAILVEGEE